ncbi:MAG: hypothetical protein KBB14_15160 [Thermoanaerobaculia bacterium]|nr:hypothetical protein [Thermoanaerobaculia bacterium]
MAAARAAAVSARHVGSRSGAAGWTAGSVVAVIALGTAVAREGSSTLVVRHWNDLPLAVLILLKVLAIAAISGLTVVLLSDRACAPGTARPVLSGTATGLALLATTAAGAALRLAPESVLPFRLWADTLFFVRPALRTPGQFPWWGGTWFGDCVPLDGSVAPHAYAACADALFGLLGTGEGALLALSALPSIAAILAAAWLAAEIGGRESAVVATVLLSFSAWPIIHGRWGYTSVALVPLAVAGTAALVRAWRRGSLPWALLGGALAGATALTYPAAWPFLAALAPALLLAWRGDRGRRKLLLAGAAVGIFVPLLVLLPAWLDQSTRIGGRARDVWVGAAAKDIAVPGQAGIAHVPIRLAYNVWHYASLLAGATDPNARHSMPGSAPLPALIGALAIVGAACLARDRGAARWIVGGLAAGGLLAGVAASPAAVPNTQRAAVFLVAAFVLAAGAIARLPRSRPGVIAATGVVAVGLIGTDVRLVLGSWSENRTVDASFLPVEVEAGRMLSRLAPAPIVIVGSAVRIPLAVETLASAGAPRPIRAAHRVTPVELACGRLGPDSRFWVLARREDLEHVDPGLLRLGRGVSPSPLAPDVVLVRGVRPATSSTEAGYVFFAKGASKAERAWSGMPVALRPVRSSVTAGS